MLGRVGNQADLVSVQRISVRHPKAPPWFWFKGHLKGDLRQGDRWLGRKILRTWASRAGLPVELSSTVCPHPAPHQASVFLPSKWDGVSLPYLSGPERSQEGTLDERVCTDPWQGPRWESGKGRKPVYLRASWGPPGTSGYNVQHSCSVPWGQHPQSTVQGSP